MEIFEAAYEKRFGHRPVSIREAEAVILNRLAKKVGDNYGRVVEMYLDDSEDFLVARGHNPRFLPGKADGYLNKIHNGAKLTGPEAAKAESLNRLAKARANGELEFRDEDAPPDDEYVIDPVEGVDYTVEYL